MIDCGEVCSIINTYYRILLNNLCITKMIHSGRNGKIMRNLFRGCVSNLGESTVNYSTEPQNR